MKTPHPTNTTNKKQKRRLAFPTYDEGDILNLDAVIVTPPPRQSGTIEVKLIYEEPSKPIPVEILGKSKYSTSSSTTTSNIVWG